MEDFIYIGRVANAHGVRGTLKIFPTTDDVTRFELLDELYIEDIKGQTKCYTIQSVKYLNKFVLLDLEDVDTMDDALKLKQGIVKIDKELALPLENNEYYISDLIGLEVVSDEGTPLGKLKDILFTGSNDVYVVGRKGAKDLLIPAIKDCIKKVDFETNKLIIHIIEGLID
jgi:16S rRNA processing protein RimM